MRLRWTVAVYLLILSTLPAAGQQPGLGMDRGPGLGVPVEPAEAQATFRFDIPSGPLGMVLGAFQSLTGVTVVTPLAEIRDLASQGVSGVHSTEQALERLLAGTGLTFRITAPNTYTVEVLGVTASVEVRAGMPYRVGATTTATKTLTPLRDVPQSVTIVTHELISDQKMQSMADVVRYMPGIGMAQGEGNRDAPIFRGQGTTADLFVDGVRDDVQYFRDLYNIDYVEALKGPNAMIFGRGGAGGVLNRVTRQAEWSTVREITLQGGSHDNRRAEFDFNSRINPAVAARLTGVYENSGSYRRGVNLERYGVNPTLTFKLRDETTVRVGYERFHDNRTADRGIPAFGNRPFATDVSTFFGNPDISDSIVTVDAFTADVDRRFRSGVQLRNRTRFANYDKFYQNVYPGSAVSASGTTVTISAYNNFSARQNLFNQTDLTLVATTGSVTHTLLAGAELGRQVTENFRNQGFFPDVSLTAFSFVTSVNAPTVSVPVAFVHNEMDTDNRGTATVAALYVQDQVELTRHVQAILGVRYDRFDMDFRGRTLVVRIRTRDHLVAPRAGLIYKPTEPVSVYASYSLASLPRAGDQLSSLSLTNAALDPEQFRNLEFGTKWDVRPDLSLTAAVYQMDRTNIAVPNPGDPTRSLLIPGQRTKGVEVGATGTIAPGWIMMGGYSYQDGRITRTLANAQAGAVLAQDPAHTFSLWNKYSVTQRWAGGAGVIHNGEMFTSTDNTVVLPGFTRVDGALFVTLTQQLRAQANIENLFDRRYYASAHGNNNILPGASRTVRVSLTAQF